MILRCIGLFVYTWGLSVRERLLRKVVWDMVGHRLGAVVLVEGRVDKNFAVCAFMVMTAFFWKRACKNSIQ